MNHYSSKQDGALSYELAIDALREIGVRAGECEPRNPREQIQREQGRVDNNQLDVVRAAAAEGE